MAGEYVFRAVYAITCVIDEAWFLTIWASSW
jgi:hypothetical protein